MHPSCCASGFCRSTRQEVPALPTQVADTLLTTHQAPELLRGAGPKKKRGQAPWRCLEQGLLRPADLAQPNQLGSGPVRLPAAALAQVQAPACVLQLPAECWALGRALPA